MLDALLQVAPIGLSILGDLFGGESPQERAQREYMEMVMREAQKIDEQAAELDRRAEQFGVEARNVRGRQIGGASVAANKAAVGLYDRALSNQNRALAAAQRANLAGRSQSYLPALESSFAELGGQGAEIEQRRASLVGNIEDNYARNLALQRQMFERGADLRTQANRMRVGAKQGEVALASPYNAFESGIASAALGSQLGKSFLDLRQAFNVGGSSSQSSSNASGLGLGSQGGVVSNRATRFNNPRITNPRLINEMIFVSDNPMFLDVPRYAMGGRVRAGEPVIVGDSPTGEPTGNEEIFIPDQDGTILPSENTERMMGNMSELEKEAMIMEARERKRQNQEAALNAILNAILGDTDSEKKLVNELLKGLSSK